MSKDPSKAIEDAVLEASKLVFSVRGQMLESCWHVGRLASSLQSSYGESTIKEFAKSLGKVVGSEMSDSTVYRARQFFQRTTAERLKEMIASNLSWTQVVPTLGAPAEIVESVIDQVIEGTLEPTKLAETVKVAVDGDEDPEEAKARNDAPESEEDKMGTPDGVGRVLAKAVTAVTAAADLLTDSFIAMDKFDNLDVGDQKNLRKTLEDLNEQLGVLSSAGGAIKEKLATTLALKHMKK